MSGRTSTSAAPDARARGSATPGLLRSGVTTDEARAPTPEVPEAARAAGPAPLGLVSSPPPPADGAPTGPARDLAWLAQGRGAPRVADPDEARAAVTRALILELAPRLGIDLQSLVIRVDGEAERKLDARGASGLQEGATIYLHPKRYQPARPFGRFLLAHEAVHAAQRKGAAAAASLPQAEREADAIAGAFAVARPAAAPVLALASTTAAAFEGTEEPAVTEAQLGALVRETHADELERITKALSYGPFDWKITDGDVEDVLRILEGLPFPTQVELIRALEAPCPAHLADNVSEGHFKRFRTSILASYYAIVQRGEVAALQDDPFMGMSFTGLAAEEHLALRAIIPAFRGTAKGRAWNDGLDPKRRGQVADLLSRDSRYDALDERRKAFKAERERQATQRAAAKAAGGTDPVATFIKEARDKLSYGVLDWAITDSEALTLLDHAAAFAGKTNDLAIIVSALEAQGYMDRWVDNIPVDHLYTDAPIQTAGAAPVSRRNLFLQLMVLRPAWKLSRAAEDLLSKGLLDWAVTDQDAFLAFQLVKALPEAARKGFYADQRGFAATLDGELSLSMKKGRAANYYTGGEEGSDLASIKAQLLDDALWTKEKLSTLRQVIQMAQAADEGPWVFEQSKDRFARSNALPQLYQDSEFFTRVVRPFALYVPKGFLRPDGQLDPGRETYVPEQVRGKPFGTDNAVWMYLVEGLGFIFHSKRVQLFRDSIGGEGLDLGEFQDLTGGSFLGAELRRASEAGAQDRDELLDNSVRWDLDRGILELRAARTDVENINYLTDAFKFQTGTAKIGGLHLHLEYPDKKSQRQETSLRLRIDSLVLNDLLYITSGSMLAVERLAVDGLTIDLLPDAQFAKGPGPSDSAALGAIFSLTASNLLKISGTSDALKTGALQPSTALNLTVAATAVRITGVTTSGGQHVDQIELDRVALRTHTQKEPDYRQYLVAEQARLRQRLADFQAAAKASPAAKGEPPRHHVELDTAASLQLQVASADKELANFDEAVAERTRLRDLKATQALSPADEHRLQRLDSYLDTAGMGGMALDVGHAQVRGIAGKVRMGDVTLDDVHGYGHSPGAVLGNVLGATSVNRMLRGPDYRGTVAGVELDEPDPVGLVKLGTLNLGAIDVEGAIPTEEQAAKDLAKAEVAVRKRPYDPRVIDEAARLARRNANVATYWATLREPVITAETRDQFNLARNALLADKAFHADSIVATDAVLELTHGADGAAALGLDSKSLQARGLEMNGLVIQNVDGTNVRLGASIDGGLSALMALGTKRPSGVGGALAADSLRLSGISNKYSGLAIDEVVAKELDIAGDVHGGTTHLGLSAKSIEAGGVSWAVTERMLRLQRDKLAAKATPTKAEQKQRADIDTLLGELESGKALLEEALQHLADPTLSAAARAQWEASKVDAEAMLAYWQKRVALKKLTVTDLNVDISGLGDLLASDYSFDAAAARGITVAGRGPNGQMASDVTAEGAWAALSPGTSKIGPGGAAVTGGGSAGTDKLSTGPLRGSVTYATDHISLDGFEIAALAPGALRYSGGGVTIWSEGQNTTLKTIAITARLETPLVDENDPDGDRRIASVAIKSLSIEEISGDRLNYRDHKSGLLVQLKSGKVRGVHAADVVVDLPKTDDDRLKVHAPAGGKGSFGFAGAENLALGAATAGGLVASSTLNTGSLDAGVLDDGTIELDVMRLALDAGHLTQKDLDVRFNAKSPKLHVTIQPGGGVTLRAPFSLNAKGKKGANEFDTSIDGDTGDVRFKDGWVFAPAVSLKNVAINRLKLAGQSFALDVPAGQTVSTEGDTKVSLSIERNLNPVGEQSAIKRIFLQEVTVPKINVKQFTLDVNSIPLTLSLPAGKTGTLETLTLKPGSDPRGFAIEPDKDWDMVGALSLNKATLGGLEAKMKDVFEGTADASAEGFNLEFAKGRTKTDPGDTVIDLKLLTLTAVDGKVYRLGAGGLPADMPFKIAKGGPYDPRELTLKGFHQDKDGRKLSSAGLRGFEFKIPDQGVTIFVREAELPTGLDWPATPEGAATKPITIPKLTITDADLTVDDVLKLGGGAAAAAKPGAPTFGPDWTFLDKLNGHVNTDLTVDSPAFPTGFHPMNFEIGIPITGGKVPFSKVTERALGSLTAYVDLVYDNPKYGSPRLAFYVGGDQTWWNLTGAEAALAKSGQVQVSMFLTHPLHKPAVMPWHKPSPPTTVSRLDASNLDVELNLPASTDIKLGTAGHIRLGGARGFSLTAMQPGAVTGAVPLGMSASIEDIDLLLTAGGARVQTNAVEINKVRGASITFKTRTLGAHTMDLPEKLEGTIGNAEARDIRVTLPPAAKSATPAGTPGGKK